ncbi:putative E3 ubiquitin ligase protein [Dioscorea alata]|uniref:E3 ubiquitin ligase protein n=2 Tax=Dioscorea alata TaxID=55571 RepID=A0ACB7UNG3_DIOAL|nr:putative E3 ubiquitin ligase protein [Dioscorea alata]
MPAQKRPHPPDDPDDLSVPPNDAVSEPQPLPDQHPEISPVKDESDGEDDSASSQSEAVKEEYIIVKLSDVRKEVQCPICLGIIRKTRTVMECLHRFCRECIDKSMRLGNNECPACRTHCASRRSLRDDPNYDTLIATLYPEIDKYEEEETAFHEEERTRNKRIQATIAETSRRQSEALGKKRPMTKPTTAVFTRRSSYRNAHGQNNYMRGRRRSSRNTSFGGSDDDEEDVNGNDGGKDSTSAEEHSPDLRSKRCKRWTGPRSSPARTSANTDVGSEDNEDQEGSRINLGTSPLRAGTREILAWGKGGTRSQNRHGSAGGSNGRFVKCGRMSKMVDFLRNLDEKDDEFDIQLTLLPLDESLVPHLEQPYICCRPTLSIRHLCHFIALEISAQAEEVEISIKKPENGGSASEEFQVIGAQETVSGLHASFSSHHGDLVLSYRLRCRASE